MYRGHYRQITKNKQRQTCLAVWRGKTAYKDDVIKCFHVDYDKDGENFLF